MRKYTLLVLVIFCCCCSARAQNPMNMVGHLPFEHYNAFTRYALQQQRIPAAARGNAIQERLISSSYTEPGNRYDSAYYKYSGTNGSVLYNNDLRSYREISYNPGLNLVNPDPLNLNRDMPGIRFDAAYSVFVSTDTSETSVVRNYYPAGFKETNLYEGGSYATDYYNYNNSGKLINSTDSFFLNGTFLNTNTWQMQYSANQLLRLDTLSKPTTGPSINGTPAANRYIYDAGNHLTGIIKLFYPNGNTDTSYVSSFTYYPNGLLRTSLLQNNAGNGVRNQELDSFAYSGTNQVKGYSTYWDWDTLGNAQLYKSVFTNHYNAQNNVDTAYLLIEDNGVLLPYSRSISTYTSDNHYRVIDAYLHNGQGYDATPAWTYRFYYEQHPTAIATIQQEQPSIALYPVPAQDYLNIKQEQGTVSGPAQILNGAGQVVLRIPDLRGFGNRIPVGGLARGHYFLCIQTDQGMRNMPFVKL